MKPEQKLLYALIVSRRIKNTCKGCGHTFYAGVAISHCKSCRGKM